MNPIPIIDYPLDPPNVADFSLGKPLLKLLCQYRLPDGSIIPWGFLWSASVPRLAWSLFYPPYHPKVQMPSLIHDWESWLHFETDPKKSAKRFRANLEFKGVNKFKRSMGYRAVLLHTGYWKNTPEEISRFVDIATLPENENIDPRLLRLPAEIAEVYERRKAA